MKIRKIVVACDSFKGSLSSGDVALYIRRGILLADSGIEVEILPMADGGEGTTDVLARHLNAQFVTAQVHDPLMRPITARYAIAPDAEAPTAIIDMASASGLTLLAEGERNPAVASTFGTGELIAHAYDAGCRNFIVGIGGSATNDAGTGMLRALGVRFLDAEGGNLPEGGAALSNLCSIDTSHARKEILDSHFTIVCDVKNPLCGTDGASHVFAPQKGADHNMVLQLDAALSRFAQVVKHVTGNDVSTLPGAGAAGGLGSGFAAFFNASLRSGIDTVLDYAHFDEAIADAQLIITGEGRSDLQTLYGKVPYGILQRSRGVPVVIVSGGVAHADRLREAGFAGAFSIVQGPCSLDDAMKGQVAAENLITTTSQIINLIQCCQQ